MADFIEGVFAILEMIIRGTAYALAGVIQGIRFALSSRFREFKREQWKQDPKRLFKDRLVGASWGVVFVVMLAFWTFPIWDADDDASQPPPRIAPIDRKTNGASATNLKSSILSLATNKIVIEKATNLLNAARRFREKSKSNSEEPPDETPENKSKE
ncbi:MAG: hypothetical protein ACI9VS_002272 [Candidatus Binatia bacterium]|jgi:hypothetical protein